MCPEDRQPAEYVCAICRQPMLDEDRTYVVVAVEGTVNGWHLDCATQRHSDGSACDTDPDE